MIVRKVWFFFCRELDWNYIMYKIGEKNMICYMRHGLSLNDICRKFSKNGPAYSLFQAARDGYLLNLTEKDKSCKRERDYSEDMINKLIV